MKKNRIFLGYFFSVIIILSKVNISYCQELSTMEKEKFKELQQLIYSQDRDIEAVKKELKQVPQDKQLIMANLDCAQKNRNTSLAMTIINNLVQVKQGKIPYVLVADNAASKDKHHEFRNLILDTLSSVKNIEGIKDAERQVLIITFEAIAADETDISYLRNKSLELLQNLVWTAKAKNKVTEAEVAEAREVIIRLLIDADERLQITAIVCLVKNMEDPGKEALWEVFNERQRYSSKVQEALGVALAQWGEPRIVPPLLEALEQTTAEQEFLYAVATLAYTKDKRVIKPLWKNLNRFDSTQIIEKLSQMEEFLINDLRENDEENLETAIKLLGEIRSRKALTELNEKLAHNNPVIRTAVVHTLEKIEDPQALSLLENRRSEEKDQEVIKRIEGSIRRLKINR